MIRALSLKLSRRKPKDSALPAGQYLSRCIDDREAIEDLINGYDPKDQRYAAYGSEARALWVVREKLVECAFCLQEEDQGDYDSILNALQSGVARLQAARQNDLSANTHLDGDSPCCLFRAIVYQASGICVAVKHFLCTEGVFEEFPEAAAHALIVLSHLIDFNATLYILAWARPYGLSGLRDVLEEALENATAWGILPGSLLALNLASVFDHMQSTRFRDDRALIKRIKLPPPQPLHGLARFGASEDAVKTYIEPAHRRTNSYSQMSQMSFIGDWNEPNHNNCKQADGAWRTAASYRMVSAPSSGGDAPCIESSSPVGATPLHGSANDLLDLLPSTIKSAPSPDSEKTTPSPSQSVDKTEESEVTSDTAESGEQERAIVPAQMSSAPMQWGQLLGPLAGAPTSATTAALAAISTVAAGISAAAASAAAASAAAGTGTAGPTPARSDGRPPRPPPALAAGSADSRARQATAAGADAVSSRDPQTAPDECRKAVTFAQ